MSLVDERVFGFGWGRVLPYVGLGLPDLGAENLCDLVLHHALAIGGNAFVRAAVPHHPELVEHFVLEGEVGQFDFPVAIADGVEGELRLYLPVGEVAVEDRKSVV